MPTFTIEADHEDGMVRITTPHVLDVVHALRMAEQLTRAAREIMEAQHQEAIDAKRFASLDEQDAAGAAIEAAS
jgi:predicted pyridoxine 5'-phosphate oxidase superfamily flavin-nucleotide-binding protein